MAFDQNSFKITLRNQMIEVVRLPTANYNPKRLPWDCQVLLDAYDTTAIVRSGVYREP
jgi:hypothetical protein